MARNSAVLGQPVELPALGAPRPLELAQRALGWWIRSVAALNPGVER